MPFSSLSSSSTSSSLASSPKGGGIHDLATTTQASKSRQSPTTATSTTRVPASGPAFSHKVGSTGSKNGDDNVLLPPFSPAESDVYQHPTAHTPYDPALEEVHVDLELSDLVLASSSSSFSSDDDDDSLWSGGSSVSLGSVVSRRRRGRSREGERLVDLQDISRATAGDVNTILTTSMTVQASPTLQDASTSRSSRVVALPISPRDDGHRRYNSGDPSRSTPRKRITRRVLVTKEQEPGFSRDFLLIVALCVGFACAIVLVGRPAMLVLVQSGGGSDLD